MCQAAGVSALVYKSGFFNKARSFLNSFALESLVFLKKSLYDIAEIKIL